MMTVVTVASLDGHHCSCRTGRGRYVRCVHGDRATAVDDAKDSSSKIITWR
jgi:hypothetical protein